MIENVKFIYPEKYRTSPGRPLIGLRNIEENDKNRNVMRKDTFIVRTNAKQRGQQWNNRAKSAIIFLGRG